MDGLNNAFGGMSELDKKAFKKAQEFKPKSEAERELVEKTTDSIWLKMEVPEYLDFKNQDLIERIKEADLHQEEKGAFQKRERLRFEYSENLADMLVNDTKWYGQGSNEMIHVQAQTIKLFNALEKNFEGDPLEQLKEVSGLFEEAIKACSAYESKKNPWFSTGKRRKKMVEDLRAQLEIQRDQMNGAIESYVQGKYAGYSITDMVNAPYDFLYISAIGSH